MACVPGAGRGAWGQGPGRQENSTSQTAPHGQEACLYMLLAGERLDLRQSPSALSIQSLCSFLLFFTIAGL